MVIQTIRDLTDTEFLLLSFLNEVSKIWLFQILYVFSTLHKVSMEVLKPIEFKTTFYKKLIIVAKCAVFLNFENWLNFESSYFQS